MQPQPQREVHYDGVHCSFAIERHPGTVVVLRIRGTDVGEFGDAPMGALADWFSAGERIDFFIDAREVQGASIEVSGEWAQWLGRHKENLRKVTMLTGSRFIQVTAEFVRRFADLEPIMRICTEPEVFDRALASALGG